MCNSKPVVNRDDKVGANYVEIGIDIPDSLVKPHYIQSFFFEVLPNQPGNVTTGISEYEKKDSYNFQTVRSGKDWKMRLIRNGEKDMLSYHEFSLYQFIVLNMKIRMLYSSKEDQKDFFEKVNEMFKFTSCEITDAPTLKPLCYCYNWRAEMCEMSMITKGIHSHGRTINYTWFEKDVLRAIYTIGNIFLTFRDGEADRVFNLTF